MVTAHNRARGFATAPRFEPSLSPRWRRREANPRTVPTDGRDRVAAGFGLTIQPARGRPPLLHPGVGPPNLETKPGHEGGTPTDYERNCDRQSRLVSLASGESWGPEHVSVGSMAWRPCGIYENSAESALQGSGPGLQQGESRRREKRVLNGH